MLRNSNAQFTPHARHDKTVLSVSCLVCRCELDDFSERARTSNFSSPTVLRCRESNSHRRGRQDMDRTVLSGLAWRCELDITEHVVARLPARIAIVYTRKCEEKKRKSTVLFSQDLLVDVRNDLAQFDSEHGHHRNSSGQTGDGENGRRSNDDALRSGGATVLH